MEQVCHSVDFWLTLVKCDNILAVDEYKYFLIRNVNFSHSRKDINQQVEGNIPYI